MQRLKLIVLSMTCAILASCQTLPVSLPTVQTISCGQHSPDVTLPDYPVPTSADLSAYVAAQAEWGTKAAGAFQNEKILRHNTAACLDALAAKGLIIQGN